jgi:hypothetical protein
MPPFPYWADEFAAWSETYYDTQPIKWIERPGDRYTDDTVAAVVLHSSTASRAADIAADARRCGFVAEPLGTTGVITIGNRDRLSQPYHPDHTGRFTNNTTEQAHE